jgi:hypothetical protein
MSMHLHGHILLVFRICTICFESGGSGSGLLAKPDLNLDFFRLDESFNLFKIKKLQCFVLGLPEGFQAENPPERTFSS